MTPDKPAGEMPDEVTVSRIKWEDGYILTLMDYGDCPDPARQTARYLRADKPDAAAAREVLSDFESMWRFIDLCNQGYGTCNNDFMRKRSIEYIKRILQQEVGV